jgi:hypothetical protein
MTGWSRQKLDARSFASARCIELTGYSEGIQSLSLFDYTA